MYQGQGEPLDLSLVRGYMGLTPSPFFGCTGPSLSALPPQRLCCLPSWQEKLSGLEIIAKKPRIFFFFLLLMNGPRKSESYNVWLTVKESRCFFKGWMTFQRISFSSASHLLISLCPDHNSYISGNPGFYLLPSSCLCSGGNTNNKSHSSPASVV